MTQSFVYAVLTLDHALIWRDGLEPGAKPIRLDASKDNPQYRKQHNAFKGDRDRSTMDQAFAEIIAHELGNASHIYLLSAGDGKSNSAQQLLDFMKEKHPELAAKVLGTGSADVNALSDNQLLELGRDRKNLFLSTRL